MTKEQRIEAFKSDYPELFKQVNGERLQLTSEEYEATIAEWADNAIAKEAEEAIQAQKEADRESGIATLKSLGLTDAQINALIG